MARKKQVSTPCPGCQGKLDIVPWYDNTMLVCMNWRCSKYRQPAFQRRYQEARRDR